MERLRGLSELLQFQTVERAFRREVWLDFERTVPVETALRPLFRHRHMLPVWTVADEEAVPRSRELLSTT